ncbi:LysR family transcriptional regulator [Nocardioides antri]|uniref:LysR family transcriptional regulator n=1 Tax=Nocardioides antri TaxID=2607659 RepID=A0A5B1M6Z0_9ACTN|nr:LysR family transcriptional regulator [Nocardioides antri]KAA1428762.1 LysR family transcriptional regulator [Nocardioides antri]
MSRTGSESLTGPSSTRALPRPDRRPSDLTLTSRRRRENGRMHREDQRSRHSPTVDAGHLSPMAISSGGDDADQAGTICSPSTRVDCTAEEIRAFVQLIASGSFTAAAQASHISQPGLSARIARLERALECQLVDRSHRPVTLTPSGQIFHAHAVGVLRALERAAAAARGVRDRSVAGRSSVHEDGRRGISP